MLTAGGLKSGFEGGESGCECRPSDSSGNLNLCTYFMRYSEFGKTYGKVRAANSDFDELGDC